MWIDLLLMIMCASFFSDEDEVILLDSPDAPNAPNGGGKKRVQCVRNGLSRLGDRRSSSILLVPQSAIL